MQIGQSACLMHPPSLFRRNTTYGSELLCSEALSLTHDEVNQIVLRHGLREFNASLEVERDELDVIGIVLEFESFLSGMDFLLLHIGLIAKCLFYLIISLS